MWPRSTHAQTTRSSCPRPTSIHTLSALHIPPFGYFNGIGFSPFGIDDTAKGGQGAALGALFEDTYRVLRPMLPIILRYQYTGKLHPILQGLANGEDWKQSIRVGDKLAANVDFTASFDPVKGRACGMIIELAPDDFVVMGTGFDVTFREMEGPLRDAEVISIEEGTFQGEQWVPPAASMEMNATSLCLTDRPSCGCGWPGKSTQQK